MNYVKANKIKNILCDISITKMHNNVMYDGLIHSINNKTVYVFTRLLGFNIIRDDIIKYLRLCEINHDKYCCNFKDEYYNNIENDFNKMCKLIESISININKLPNQPLQSNIEQLIKLIKIIKYLKEKVSI